MGDFDDIITNLMTSKIPRTCHWIESMALHCKFLIPRLQFCNFFKWNKLKFFVTSFPVNCISYKNKCPCGVINKMSAQGNRMNAIKWIREQQTSKKYTNAVNNVRNEESKSRSKEGKEYLCVTAVAVIATSTVVAAITAVTAIAVIGTVAVNSIIVTSSSCYQLWK